MDAGATEKPRNSSFLHGGTWRTGLLLACAGLLSGWGVWSCQTSTSEPAPADRATPWSGPPAVQTTEPEMRVRVKSGVTSARMDGVERFTISGPGAEAETVRGPLVLGITPRAVTLTDGLGRTHTFGVAASPTAIGAVEIAAAGAAAGDPSTASASKPMLRIDGKAYPGRVRAIWRPARSMAEAPDKAAGPAATVAPPPPAPGVPTLDIVEIVPLETYIAGVIAKELYATWPLGAYEVQAVCARTYALHERERSFRNGEDYDVESSTLDQAYDGSTGLGVAQRGVDHTRGVVLTWKGTLLRAYYSSTCGGRAASAADIWPTTNGYEFNLADPLQGHARDTACDESPAYRWEVSRDTDDLARRFREWGKSTGNPVAAVSGLKSLKVKESNAVGRPTQFVLTDAKGARFNLAAEEFRVACNYAAPGLPAVTSKTRVRSGDAELEVKGVVAIIRGRGFGHGVGMCQYCTKAFAERGDTWRQMLARFYPGATLERIY